MSKKIAVLQVADTGPLESLVVMLESVGYQCHLPDKYLLGVLRSRGLDTVLSTEDLVLGMGYEAPRFSLPAADVKLLREADLYVDVKAHRNGPKLWKLIPQLERKTLWYRINGGQPEHVIRRDERGNITEDCGDEINPPCPVLTPNQWYHESQWECNKTGAVIQSRVIAEGKAYCCWPPFLRWDDHQLPRRDPRATGKGYFAPMCLIHNLQGWGYGGLIEGLRAQGVLCHGAGSPDGLIKHEKIPELLSRALCLVHLKSSDAPGYALYEALASGCPVICPRRLMWKENNGELLEERETCLCFDKIGHQGLSEEDVKECLWEIKEHIGRLTNPTYNRIIGEAGKRRLRELLWSPEKEDDVESLREFMERNFPS